MTPLLDWALLAVQTVAIGFIVVRELLRSSDRNIYALGIGATMLVLVQGQAWWMLDQVLNHGLHRHINQAVTVHGVELAVLYCLVWTVAFCLAYLVALRPRTAHPRTDGSVRRAVQLPARQRVRGYVIPAIWLLLTCSLLVIHSGGPGKALLQPGRLIPGQTVLLILLGMGKMPLLSDLAEKKRSHPLGLTIYGLTFAFLLLNSRFLALFLILQTGLVWNYCVRELARKHLIGGAAVAALILLGYGLFRDFESNRGSATSISVPDFIHFYSQRSAGGPFDWFYRFNVEGFAGLAGILTRATNQGGIRHDFGASTLAILTQLIPNAIRTDPHMPFHRVAQFFDSLYPYPGGSVVRPGLELAYAHFDVPGIVALGLLLGWLAISLDRRMRSPGRDRLLVAVLSVQTLLLIRGTFVDALFFGLGDLAMLFAYRQIQILDLSQLIDNLTKRLGQARGLHPGAR